ncbi:MAG: rRNA ((2503)-C(2))-methyltransferase [Clostridiales bacterium]|jgi:23S rRNA (adenine2503-C2)-methyltransferase|nr:rRNA ((2503)-C(2))-methyltransferase [Clostridiales bacterium]
MARINLLELNLADCQQFVAGLGQQRFRARQLLNWIYKNKVFDFAQMLNLSKEFRQVLAKEAKIVLPKLTAKQVSKLDGTTKYLFELEDGEKIETVYMPHKDGQDIKRHSLCVSSQVGCPIGCTFCATGQAGFTRNMETAEIIGQILAVENEENIKITNIVFMGMGEPLLNYANVLRAIRIITDKECLDISARKITVSTSGIVPQIRKLADENLPIVLAVSLHTPWDEKRNKIVPINKKYSITDIINSCKYFVDKTNRKVTFEYTLIKGVNDSPEDASKLGDLLQGLLCNVNLIPVNAVKGTDFLRPSKKDIYGFINILHKKGIESVIRIEKGSDIDAACGQLRGKE